MAGCVNIKASLTYPCYCFVVHLRSAFIYASGNLNSCILMHTHIYTYICVYKYSRDYSLVSTTLANTHAYAHLFTLLLLYIGRQIYIEIYIANI